MMIFSTVLLLPMIIFFVKFTKYIAEKYGFITALIFDVSIPFYILTLKILLRTSLELVKSLRLGNGMKVYFLQEECILIGCFVALIITMIISAVVNKKSKFIKKREQNDE